MIVSDIKQNPAVLAAAESGDWSTCARELQAVSTTAEPRLCFSVETSLAILAVGGNPNEIMTAMDRDATGKFLLVKLATVGVMWAHPLTVAYLDAAVAANGLGQVSRDAAVQLSAPTTFPFADVTEEQCRDVWAAEEQRIRADELQSQWVSVLNEHINTALASGDKATLIAAMKNAINLLET